MFSLFKKKEALHKLVDIQLDPDFTIKPLFGAEFDLLSVDLLETLGTGTFGRVRLVRALTDKKFYALKILKKARIVRLRQIEHIQNEVRLLSRIRCLFVVDLHAVFQDDNCLYLMLDYIPGGELFSYIRRDGKFPVEIYQFYCVEVACALKYLHKLQIAYRDVKPENIMIDRDGHIRLVDFGFAKMIEDRTFTLCGTPEYLAPEVIQGNGHGLAVDWWALGVLLYEMCVGYPPFFGENPFIVYQKILAGKVTFPGDVATPTKNAVAGFLNQNRGKRLGSGSGGFDSVKSHPFFRGIEWNSAAQKLMMPPMVPTVTSDGDTSNFDVFPPEGSEEHANLTSEQREMFMEFDRILERPVKL